MTPVLAEAAKNIKSAVEDKALTINYRLQRTGEVNLPEARQILRQSLKEKLARQFRYLYLITEDLSLTFCY